VTTIHRHPNTNRCSLRWSEKCSICGAYLEPYLCVELKELRGSKRAPWNEWNTWHMGGESSQGVGGGGVGGKETLWASATHSHTLIFTKNLNTCCWRPSASELEG
jgi:hypothetical protein